MDYQNILVKIEGAVGVITLNRPKALNALNSELLAELIGVLWAWVGAGEEPGSAALAGGGIVVGALVFNEMLSLRGRQALRETS